MTLQYRPCGSAEASLNARRAGFKIAEGNHSKLLALSQFASLFIIITSWLKDLLQAPQEPSAKLRDYLSALTLRWKQGCFRSTYSSHALMSSYKTHIAELIMTDQRTEGLARQITIKGKDLNVLSLLEQ